MIFCRRNKEASKKFTT